MFREDDCSFCFPAYHTIDLFTSWYGGKEEFIRHLLGNTPQLSKGFLINALIHPADAETNYQTFEAVVNLVAKAGQGTFMVKEDFKSAFRNVPMAFSKLNLLGVKVEGKYFIDCILPFGVSISCKIFKDVASLIHWIAEKRVRHKFVHYLDDFFTIHRLNMVCSNIMSVFKLVCDQIGMPVSPDKSEGPTQIIEFLGLTIDTIQMVVRILKDKMQDITLILITIIRKRKAMAAELESLAGKLNFITKVVLAGRSFTKRVYLSFQGIPKHRHIDLKQPVLVDLRMWKLFLIHFKGWKPIIHPSVQRSQTMELFADASGNINLGWGAWLPHMGGGMDACTICFVS